MQLCAKIDQDWIDGKIALLLWWSGVRAPENSAASIFGIFSPPAPTTLAAGTGQMVIDGEKTARRPVENARIDPEVVTCAGIMLL